MNVLLGYLSAFAWFALAAITAAGTLLEGSLLGINFAMAALFVCAAAFLTVRTTTLAHVRRRHPHSSHVQRLLRIEAVTSCLVLLLGLACAGAALFRVQSEGVPVFG